MAPILSPLCVYRMYRPWVRIAVSEKSTQCFESVSSEQTLRRFSGLANRWMTLGDAGQLGQPRRASLLLGPMECHGPEDVCSATARRGASTLVRVAFLVAVAMIRSQLFSWMNFIRSFRNAYALCVVRRYSIRKECVLLYCLSGKSAQIQGVRKLSTVML